MVTLTPQDHARWRAEQSRALNYAWFQAVCRGRESDETGAPLYSPEESISFFVALATKLGAETFVPNRGGNP